MLRLMALTLLPLAVPAPTAPTATSPRVTAAELAGAWAGTASHEGETTPVALELDLGDDGKVLIKLSAPVVHLRHAPLGRVVPASGPDGQVTLGPFVFTYDAASRTLRGDIPEGLAPVYKLPMTLQRVERLSLPTRPEPEVPA
jgi:hypothetical protein